MLIPSHSPSSSGRGGIRIRDPESLGSDPERGYSLVALGECNRDLV